jgi:hypothetical protein
MLFQRRAKSNEGRERQRMLVMERVAGKSRDNMQEEEEEEEEEQEQVMQEF